MSIIRFINDRNREHLQLRKIIEYVKREDKLSERYITGIGINPDTAYQDMIFAKKMLHQENGKQYLHLVVSCDQIMRQPDAVHEIGKEIAAYYKDYQVLVATHSDTANLHCHLVINSVNMQNGKKLSQRRKDFWRFRNFANTVFERHNLPHIGAEQMYEVLLSEEDNYDWDDDLDDFDALITGRLEELQNKYGVQRPIFFYRQEEECHDKLRAIDRLEKMEQNLNGLEE